MKFGTPSFYLGIIALIAGIIGTFFMGSGFAFPAGLIFFSMGAMGRLFENEVVDCLVVTFVGVGALVLVLYTGQSKLGGHGSGHAAHSEAHTEAPAEHH